MQAFQNRNAASMQLSFTDLMEQEAGRRMADVLTVFSLVCPGPCPAVNTLSLLSVAELVNGERVILRLLWTQVAGGLKNSIY